MLVDAHKSIFPKNRDYDSTPDTLTKEEWAAIKINHPHLPEMTDFAENRREVIFRLPKFVEDYCVNNLIKDPRDAIMCSLILNIAFTMIPLLTTLFYFPSHKLGLCVWFFGFITWMQRFILMMHYAEHKQLWRQPYHTFGKHLLNVVMCPFIGIPPGFYRLHHVVMHHIENNVFNDDMSSTEPYQRDNFLHFLHYFAKYWTCLILLPIYAIKQQRYEMAMTAVAGASTWFTIMGVGLYYHRIFTIYTLCLPGFCCGLLMMFGNFSQHIFVHPDVATMKQDLKSFEFNCALTYQSINHSDNQYAFNDGYHVTHHINSRIHWTDMPGHFMKNIDKYAENNVVIFSGLGFFDIGINVMTQNWDVLADHYVHLGKTKMTKAEVI